MHPPTSSETLPSWPEGSLPVEASRVARRSGRRWWQRSLVVIAAVTAVAGVLRFYHLSTPHTYVFDEVYYAKDGCLDAGFPYRACKLDSPGEQTFTVHPPLGRWIVAGGEALFGNRPFGWRFASAVFGTLSVLLASILALRLFGSVLWSGVSGLLLATEALNFVQSRISMLDIFVTTFVLAGFLFLVLDRQWIGRRSPRPDHRFGELRLSHHRREADLLDLPPDRPPSPIWRPWRAAAGLAFGAAVATKWSGAPALVGAMVLSLMWERSRRARMGLLHPTWEAFRDEGFGLFVFLILLPVAVYVASYGRWWADHGLRLVDFWHIQVGMASYSIHLRAPHPYQSKAWSWLLLKRPVAYYFMGNKAGTTAAEILGLGSPLIFWGSVAAFPYLAASWRVRRDWRAGMLLVAFLAQYVPWFFASRTAFLFYMAPMTPFMVLAVAYVLRDLAGMRIGIEQTRALAPISALVVVLAVGMFVFFLPVLTGRTLSHSAWMARMWFQHCQPKATWCWI